MHLAHEHLAEIVTCLRRDFRDRMNHERRVLPRFRVWAPVDIALLPAAADGAGGTPATVTVWMRDLSRGGMGLMHTRALGAGTPFVIRLPLIDGNPMPLLCEVVYCRGATGDLFSMGCKFVGNYQG
jgi:hypothetical protein